MHRQSGKNMLNSYTFSTRSHNTVNCGPLAADSWERFESVVHPSKFQRVSRLGVVTAPTSLDRGQPHFARRLAVSCAGTLYIHFRGFLPPNGILSCAKSTLRPSPAFSYIGRVTARHSSSGRQPNCDVAQRAPPIFGRAVITLDIGPHSGCQYFMRHLLGTNLLLLTERLLATSWYCLTINCSVAIQALTNDGNWSRNDL